MKSIKNKITLIMLALVLTTAILISMVSTYANIKSTKDFIENVYLENAERMLDLYLQREFGEIIVENNNFVNSKGDKIENLDIETFAKSMGISITIFEKRANDFVRVLTTAKDENGRLIKGTKLNKESKAYKEIIEGKTYKGLNIISGIEYESKYTPIFDRNKNVIGIKFVGQETSLIKEGLNKQLISFLKLIISILLVIIIIAVAISYYIGNLIATPIVLVSNRLSDLAEYDLTKRKDKLEELAETNDEIGVISRAILKMQNNFIQLLKEVQEETKKVAKSSEVLSDRTSQVASSSEEISRTVEKIAIGVNQQANDTEDANNNVEGISGLLDENRNYLEILNKATDLIDEQKVEGFKILRDLIIKTQNTDEAIKEIHTAIESNNKSAENIEEASRMIESIAEQTNLLALNAAIEAARAGEAGRGFSVVADEIRKLAEQSNLFTGKIKEVIFQLKEKSGSAVVKMSDVKAIVSSQGESVKETGAKFESIAEAIESMKVIIDKINTSSKNMNINKNNLSEIMHNLFAIAQENSAGSEETSASMQEQASSVIDISQLSEDLNIVSKDLKKLISNFKI